MRSLVFGFTLAAYVAISQAAAVAQCGGGLLHQRHHGCQKCDETVVIHCYPPEPHHARRHGGRGFGAQGAPQAAAQAGPAMLLPYQANYGMAMQMAPVMPMMGGIMPTAFQAASQAATQQAAKDCKCDETQRARMEQLEKDFKALSGQVDDVVDSVHRNTLALETLIDKLIEKKVIVESVSNTSGLQLRPVRPASMVAPSEAPSSRIDQFLQQNRN